MEEYAVMHLSKNHDINLQTPQNIDYYSRLDDYFTHSSSPVLEKLANFTKYVPRQTITRFLSKYEIFKRVLNIQGAVIECGVFHGGGLMTFAQLSAILEPLNHQRRIIGFDTFEGFPSIHEKDQGIRANPFLHEGGLASNSYEDIKKCAELYDMNRPVGHMKRIELVKGDILETVPEYINKNPHLVVSLLYLDVDLYEPTKMALEYFYRRMPKGAVICFDQLNGPSFPGETQAVLDTIGISNLKIERIPFDTCLSFAVL